MRISLYVAVNDSGARIHHVAAEHVPCWLVGGVVGLIDQREEMLAPELQAHIPGGKILLARPPCLQRCSAAALWAWQGRLSLGRHRRFTPGSQRIVQPPSGLATQFDVCVAMRATRAESTLKIEKESFSAGLIDGVRLQGDNARGIALPMESDDMDFDPRYDGIDIRILTLVPTYYDPRATGRMIRQIIEPIKASVVLSHRKG
ncbi:hypothetical protein [Paraburkholderia adhaesiva]|uniref:hypothetical protein n=1 Tax=Paraburkholderia adhaesiva TaxID=2883244 RepID=UPI001F3892AA|nr:hypothetical protein [Paraburkholderia adhaesiva]